ncbi:MAG TPA: response regulator transcription factor [Thermoanaerobaculia bacterium]|nr:response regulator transcription factor [Thermoanaerobaculia bacterium]
MRRVLIVDDDPKVCETLDRYLAHAGYATATALDGAKALEVARSFAPDLIVLDLMLPRVDGLGVCRMLRATSSVPIIMLTAKSTERDKLTGLELGADDYLTKPFSPRELVARVEAVLRRAAKQEQSPCIVAGALTIDPERCEVRVGEALVTVTATELRLLTALAHNPGRVYRRDELARLALGDDFDGLDRTIDAHIKNLRRKVGAERIATVFGIGYKLVA